MILWYGPPYSYSGYGLHNRMVVLELNRLGLDVKLIPTEKHIPEDLPQKDILLELTKKPFPKHNKVISINCVPPPSSACRSGYSILYTTIESENMHWGAKIRSNFFEEIWIPCKQNYKAFRKAGFPRKKIFYMPEGVDPVLHSQTQGILKDHRSPLFTFLYIGDWSYRKGIGPLLSAYAKEFSRRDKVRLLLLVHYQGNDRKTSEKRILHELEWFEKNLGFKIEAELNFIFDYLKEKELSQLYNAVDCYISPSLGEAWNLPVIQAMAHELPIITTRYGGCVDYCNDKNSYLIDVEKMDTIDDKTPCHVDFYQGEKFAFPNIKHLRSLMREVFEHRAEAKEKGLRARRDCVKKWTWTMAGEKIAKRILKIKKKL